MTFAEKFHAQRKRLGLQQAACASLFHQLSVKTLRNWEGGRNEPPAWSQPLILAFLARQKPAKQSTFVERGRPPLAD